VTQPGDVVTLAICENPGHVSISFVEAGLWTPVTGLKPNTDPSWRRRRDSAPLGLDDSARAKLWFRPFSPGAFSS
jgi:hypothetical protein